MKWLLHTLREPPLDCQRQTLADFYAAAKPFLARAVGNNSGQITM